MRTPRSLSLIVCFWCVTGLLRADVKPGALFSDGAVLQREMPVPVWGTADEGEAVTVEFGGASASTTAKDGKWMVKLPAMPANASPQPLTIKGRNTVEIKDVLVGEVWMCSGQSNMAFTLAKASNGAEAVASSANPMLHLFHVPTSMADKPAASVDASWQVSGPESAAAFSAVAYFFGRDLVRDLKVPVGLILSAVGGTPAEAWTSNEALRAVPALKGIFDAQEKAEAEYPEKLRQFQEQAANSDKKKRKPHPPKNPANMHRRPSGLFNAMIAPIIPYAIRGVIWYQGEANRERTKEYQILFPTTIADWRQRWGLGDFPFLFVQISPNTRMVPELREAQLLTWKKTPNTAMAVTVDSGTAESLLHSPLKEPVGDRLALAAQALAYGAKEEYSGPVYESVEIKGPQAVVKFSHAGGGLVARGGDLKGFIIAGADRNFVPAEARIEEGTIVVSSPQVSAPVAVRYGWASIPEGNLFNKEGLPASPFRTDVE